MTRFVVDAGALLQIVEQGVQIGPEHELLAPTLLRSQLLSVLHESVQRGDLPDDVARDRLARAGKIKVRLLGDAVMRRRAWEVADELGWWETYGAEYVALTQLQADALITRNEEFAHAAGRLVRVASVDELR